jgi:hypothetical protein
VYSRNLRKPFFEEEKKMIGAGRFLWCLFAALPITCQVSDRELGYRRITMKDRIKKFYHSCGKTHLDKKVHILIPAAVFRKDPQVIRRPGGVLWKVYENKTVPVIVSPANLYLKRLDKAFQKEKKRKKKKIATVSVLGKVIQPTWDLKGRCFIMVHKIKTYGGALKKSVD